MVDTSVVSTPPLDFDRHIRTSLSAMRQGETRAMKSVKRIDKLTPEQEGRFAEWRDKWIRTGLCTDPADRQKLEQAVKVCYKKAGLAPPKRVVWVDSPIVLAFAAPTASFLLKNGGAVDDAVRDAVGGAVDDAVRGAVDDAVGGAEKKSKEKRVKEALDYIQVNWYNLIGGQLWVGSWGWYASPSMTSFFRDVCSLDFGKDMNERAQAYADTASSACWWWPHKDFVMVCERPAAIHRDDRGRLHNASGPAFLARDGWGLHFWHGIRANALIIEHPEQITVQMINQEKNAELRRVMMERYGLERYITDSGMKAVHEDMYGKLYQLPNAQLPVVLVTNSTAEPDGTFKRYTLTATRADVRTAHEAVASTFGMTAEQYQPVHES